MPPDRDTLLRRFTQIRAETDRICAPLLHDDFIVQPVDFVSPPKWHLGHTTWFFETFFLDGHLEEYQAFNAKYPFVFNSYYESIGRRVLRARRGTLSRPTLEEVRAYRAHVDRAIPLAIARTPDAAYPAFADAFDLGLNHEQQHQELLLMDIKYIFASSPFQPVYAPAPHLRPAGRMEYLDVGGGTYAIGDAGDHFAFDNERPRHDVLLAPFRIGSRLVTNGEYLEFVEQGGYRRFDVWLADGFEAVHTEGWDAPLYWELADGVWHEYTLGGSHPLDLDAPVCHVSYYEADAYARWRGVRLPTEVEWECAALLHAGHIAEGNFLDSRAYHPAPPAAPAARQMLGDAWEWTASGYLPYPGYKPYAGALGEYNGKFMVNQMVMRGGSFATPRDHIRTTYRNFFQPIMRWQFGSIRLASGA